MKSLLLIASVFVSIGYYSNAMALDGGTQVQCLIRGPMGSSGEMKNLVPTEDENTPVQIDSLSFKGIVVSYSHSNRRFVVMNEGRDVMYAELPTNPLNVQRTKFFTWDQGKFLAEIDCKLTK